MKNAHRFGLMLLLGFESLIGGGCGTGLTLDGKVSTAPAVSLPASVSSVNPCGGAAFEPNYASSTAGLLTWSRFPLSVAFVQDKNSRIDLESKAIEGFNDWANSSLGTIAFRTVASPSGAQITVRFDPGLAGGYTRMTFSGSLMRSAEIVIGTRFGDDSDLAGIASHEFGHALGINGHSTNPADVMFATHTLGTTCGITDRDMNTVRTAYCNLFSGRVSAPPMDSGTPSQTITIRCGHP